VNATLYFKSVNRWYQISLICGLAPLCIGVFIFLAWLASGAYWLEWTGMVNLYAGLVLFCIGLISLAVYFYKARRNAIRGYWKKSIVALLILLANFPVAAVIISAALYVASVSTVIIKNQSSSKIENIYLSEQGHVYEAGSVLANEKIERKFHFQSEGSIRYSFTRNDIKYEGIMFGYVTGGMGSSSKMLITKRGKVKIDEK